MLRKRHEKNTKRGFTFAEILVSLVVFTQIILMALLVFDTSSRVSRAQTRMAEMQQALRVGQGSLMEMVRLAGRSGLPVTGVEGSPEAPEFPPFGRAVSVLNNVDGDARRIVPNLDGGPQAVRGTDVLVLRGNFTAPLFQATVVSLNGDREEATEGTVSVPRSTPFIPEQELRALAPLNESLVPEALILLPSAPGQVYAVVELQPIPDNNFDDRIELAFNIKGGGEDLADRYRALWTNDGDAPFPLGEGASCTVAVLEEYRLYVSNDGGTTPEKAKTYLSRTKLLPGTGLPYGVPDQDPDPFDLRTDLAEGFLDLQISLGFDTPAGGQIGRGNTGFIFESADGSEDDWLYNEPGENPDAAPFAALDSDSVPRLYYVRLTSLARTLGPDFRHREEEISRLEDHVYPAATGWVNSPIARTYRRRVLTTAVDLRNL